LEKVEEGWRRLEKVEEGWRRLKIVGEGWRRMKKAGEGWRRLSKVRILTVEFLPVGRASRSLGSSNSSRRFLELSRTRSRTLETLEIP
jgi:hypothetical protein